MSANSKCRVGENQAYRTAQGRDLSRYARNIAVSEIGVEGQARLCGSAVLVVGCGALGSMAAMYLAGAGIGRIGLVDFDTIDITNLQRQLFFSESQGGASKAEALAEAIKSLNSEIEVNTYKTLLTKHNAREIVAGYDFVVEATDNPQSKRMVDSVCEQLGTGCCVGGVRGFEGQVTTCLPDSARYSSLFPDAENSGFTPCSQGGVLGPAAGTVASIQASEAIKALLGLPVLSDRWLVFDLLTDRFDVYAL